MDFVQFTCKLELLKLSHKNVFSTIKYIKILISQ